MRQRASAISPLQIIIALLLAACAPVAGCIPFPAGTSTPRIAPPTPTPGSATPTSAPLPYCPTRTPVQPSPLPPLPLSGLGRWSGPIRTITASPGDERLIGLTAGEQQIGLLYSDDAGRLFFAPWGSSAHVPLGSGQLAAAAFGPDQVAIIKAGGALSARVVSRTVDLTSAPDIPLPWPGGNDVAARYGPEGWLYVASGGEIQRLNPFAGAWEPQGFYTGEALEMALTGSSSLLLHSTAGVYRRPPGGAWSLAWQGHAGGVAVSGERVALAWQDANAWWTAESFDGGASWSSPDRAWRPGVGSVRAAFPLITHDGVLEVAGVYVEPSHGGAAEFAYPIVVQRGAAGWFPRGGGHPEAISPYVAQLLPAGRLLAVSEGGVSVVAWEGLQANRRYDVFSISR